MTTTYPMPPLDPHIPEPDLYEAWQIASGHVGWISTWHLDNKIRAMGHPSPFPLELTTGAELPCYCLPRFHRVSQDVWDVEWDLHPFCERHARLVAPEPTTPPCICRPEGYLIRFAADGLPIKVTSTSCFRIDPDCVHHGRRWWSA